MRIIIFLLLFSTSLFGQHHLGLKLDFGISKVIWTNYYVKSSLESVKVNSYFNLSGNIGLDYFYAFKKKSGVGIGLLFQKIEGKQIFKSDDLIYGTTTETFQQHMYYLGIPICYSLRFSKIKADIGGSFLWNVINSGDSYLQNEKGGIIINQWENKGYNLPITLIDYGVYSSLSYRIIKRLDINISNYYGMNNIFYDKTGFFDWHWRNFQLTLGIKYYFFISKSKKEKQQASNEKTTI